MLLVPLEYPQFIGLNFVVYLISLCRTDVLSSENLEKRFLFCTTVITIILLLLVPAVSFHIAATVSFDGLTEALLDLDSLRSCDAFRA